MRKLIFRSFILVVWITSSSVRPDDIVFEKIWEVQTGAGNYGGVQIDPKRLYAGGEDGILRAIDKSSGQLVWSFDAGAAIGSNVAVDDLRTYFHTREGTVHALDKNNGTEHWAFTTMGESRWDYWDYFLSTPAFDDRQLYFGSGDRHVYAVDKRSGQLRWKVETGNIVHGEPLVSGEKILVGGFDGRMYAIDRGTGRVLWRFKTVGNAYFRNGELPGSAAASDGIVYFGGRDYNIYGVLEEVGTGAWNDKTPSWIVGRPLVVGEDLIIVNSDGAAVLSYNRKSGRQNWKTINSYNMFAGAESIGSKHLAVAGLDGRITILSRQDGGIEGIYETDASRSSRDDFFTPEGKPDYSGMQTLDDLTHFYDRQLQQMGGITGSMAVDANVIYYATVSGEIAAVRVSGITLSPDEGEQP